jgi:hypothetical protein
VTGEWHTWDIDPDRTMTPLQQERQRVAATLGEVLRRAYREHVSAHGCGTAELPIFSCPDGYRLWHLRPEGDQIALA